MRSKWVKIFALIVIIAYIVGSLVLIDRTDDDVCRKIGVRIKDSTDSHFVSEKDVADFLSILDTCEFAKYSPSAGAEMAGVYEKAIDVISRIQQNVK